MKPEQPIGTLDKIVLSKFAILNTSVEFLAATGSDHHDRLELLEKAVEDLSERINKLELP